MTKTKCYPHVLGVCGDSGENPGALAVHAVLDPSQNWPEQGRIIVGSPASTPSIPGYIPDLGGFCGSVEAIERLAATLLEAARDVRGALAPIAPSTTAADDRPSIAGLQLLESALVDQPWSATHSGWIMAPNKLSPIGGTRSPARASGATESDADQQARRIANLRNAAPVLLEIAATGLAWAAAEDALQHAERGAPRSLAAMHATKAFDVHRIALAKVRP